MLAAAVLVAGLAACGAKSGSVDHRAQTCRSQWRDVAQAVYEMDSETFPSSLSERWSTVIAGAQYQRDFGDGKDCGAQISRTMASIDTLRTFSDRLRRYDMQYQLSIVAPQAELYLTDALPKKRKGVAPPPKPAVRAAYRTLQQHAAEANQQLTPGWQQALSIDLGSAREVSRAIKDLDRLAVSSPAFQQCQAALGVIVRAIKAQEAS